MVSKKVRRAALRLRVRASTAVDFKKAASAREARSGARCTLASAHADHSFAWLTFSGHMELSLTTSGPSYSLSNTERDTYSLARVPLIGARVALGTADADAGRGRGRCCAWGSVSVAGACARLACSGGAELLRRRRSAVGVWASRRGGLCATRVLRFSNDDHARSSARRRERSSSPCDVAIPVRLAAALLAAIARAAAA